MWSQDLYSRAWDFATRAHRGQTYGGAHDNEQVEYINHVASVAMELAWVLRFDHAANGDLAIQCALLHDTLEDTGTTFRALADNFGAPVAEGVSALSKNPSLSSRVEQMRDSIDRIKSAPREIWMVKLADRITNLYHAPYYWDADRISFYRDESCLILRELGAANPLLAERLQHKIVAYGRP
jgi:(p)ppGpp synthase/HD superfamily hydrolase